MNKIFYLALAIFCVSCLDDEHQKPSLKGVQSLGIIHVHVYSKHELVTFHDMANNTTCYIVVPQYESETYSISCVKDEMPPSK